MSRGTLKKIRLRDMCLGTCGRPVVVILLPLLPAGDSSMAAVTRRRLPHVATLAVAAAAAVADAPPEWQRGDFTRFSLHRDNCTSGGF